MHLCPIHRSASSGCKARFNLKKNTWQFEPSHRVTLSAAKGSVSIGREMLRCAQHDSVWITVIITWFPIIVTESLRRPLNGLEAIDTMRVKRVMMSVIHT